MKGEGLGLSTWQSTQPSLNEGGGGRKASRGEGGEWDEWRKFKFLMEK